MAKIGRPRKYGTQKALEAAVNAYFASISYEIPAVVRTPTGAIDENGRILYEAKMLTEKADGTGRPKTLVEYLEPPSVAGLCLYLGISRDTWAGYGGHDKLGTVVDKTRTRLEAYLVAQLEGRHVQGVIFNLKNNYGWKDKTEIGMDAETRKAVAGADMTMEEKRELLEAAAKDFAGDNHHE